MWRAYANIQVERLLGIVCRMAKPVFDASMRIVVLAGRDDFLVPYCTRQLIEVLEAAHGEVDRFEFNGDSASAADVLDELRTYGLLQQHKLVVVTKADRFLVSKGGASGPSRARTLLEQYAQSPVADATLLLRADTWHRSKLDKLIDAVGIVHKVKPLNQPDTLRWVSARVGKAHNGSIDPAAAQRLVRRVGCDLARLDAELAKLAAMCREDQSIDSALVDEAVPLSREEKAWVIQEAILTGGAPGGLTMLRELLGVSRQSDVLVAWAVTDMLKRLHAASRLQRAGVGDAQLRKDLKLWGPGGDATLSAARRADPSRLAHLLGDALRSQQRLRRGIGTAQRMLDLLVIRVSAVVSPS